MKTKLLFAWTALAMMFTACEEEETSFTKIIYSDEPVKVNVYAGMPGVYGRAHYYNNAPDHPIPDVNIKIYQTKKDYLLDENVLTEGLTDTNGKFTFEYDSTGSLWFGAYKDTLSNLRGISEYSEYSDIEYNEIIINEQGSKEYENYHKVYATLTNIPTRLQLSVSHQGEPIEGATVQLYFTEQTYLDSLPAQEDSVHLRPTYGYRRLEASDSKFAFTNRVRDNFLQTTDEEGIVVFDNLEPRNYWFCITKDTLSNKNGIIRTREALPRDAVITTMMTVGVK